MLNENGLTFKDFEKKTFEMICKLGQEYTRDFLERYDTGAHKYCKKVLTK